MSPSNKLKFELFMDQQSRFREALWKYDRNIWYPPLRGRPTEDNPGNWFMCFVPASWGRWEKAIYGVHFAFMYGRACGSRLERIKLPVGVETPMEKLCQQEFKKSVISRVNAEGISQSGFILQCKPNTKLLEVDHIPFNKQSWEVSLERYIALQPVIKIIARVLQEYHSRGAFKVPLDFKIQ